LRKSLLKIYGYRIHIQYNIVYDYRGTVLVLLYCRCAVRHDCRTQLSLLTYVYIEREAVRQSQRSEESREPGPEQFLFFILLSLHEYGVYSSIPLNTAAQQQHTVNITDIL
jgi:hypothetical protein